MTSIHEEVANFICELAYLPKVNGRIVTQRWRSLTVEEVRYLWAARRDLATLQRLAANSDSRSDDIKACHDVINDFLGQCMEGEKPKPDPAVFMDRDQIETLPRAAVYLIEFQIRKRVEGDSEKFHQANRGQYKGRK